MDIATRFIDFTRGADFLAPGAGAGLVSDDGLETAVILSLFTDRQAQPDDPLPGREDDRRGWWGDAFPDVPGDRIGSRLWLLWREKQTSANLVRAELYATEALAWLVADGVARSVDVVASIPRNGVLGLDIAISRPASPPVKYRFDRFWRGGDAI